MSKSKFGRTQSPVSAPAAKPEAPAARAAEPELGYDKYPIPDPPVASFIDVPGSVKLPPVEFSRPGDQPGVVESDQASPIPGKIEQIARPGWEDFKAAAELGALVEARIVHGNVPQLRAGLVLYGEFRRFSLASVAECGESHLRALSSDPDIDARIVFAEPV